MPNDNAVHRPPGGLRADLLVGHLDEPTVDEGSDHSSRPPPIGEAEALGDDLDRQTFPCSGEKVEEPRLLLTETAAHDAARR